MLWDVSGAKKILPRVVSFTVSSLKINSSLLEIVDVWDIYGAIKIWVDLATDETLSCHGSKKSVTVLRLVSSETVVQERLGLLFSRHNRRSGGQLFETYFTNSDHPKLTSFKVRLIRGKKVK